MRQVFTERAGQRQHQFSATSTDTIFHWMRRRVFYTGGTAVLGLLAVALVVLAHEVCPYSRGPCYAVFDLRLHVDQNELGD